MKRAFSQVKQFINDRGNERLKEQWADWGPRFKVIHDQSLKRPKVEISLVGGTGAGKSTLLNALIGARVLPVSNMRACTAAISEVSYAEGEYRARVEFIPRESWNKEVNILLDDLRDAQFSGNGEANDPAAGFSRVAFDKLWTVYKPAEDADKKDFDPFDLEEPTEITEALDRGTAEIRDSTLTSFRKNLKVYLDSQHRFWPIVKSVSIRGPFEALRDGAKLVDLPGVNDPNEAREAVTKTHLKTCRFVWIVFNIKRALTRDTLDLMQSDDFTRQIVLDGRADALTFVGTASDDLDLDTAIDEFDLDDDVEFPVVVDARNKAVRHVVLDQLDDLASRLAHLANESPESARKLAEKLKGSEVLTVSAKEYLRIVGLSRDQSVRLNDVQQTQIPQLCVHMQQICANYGVEAHVKSLNHQLETLLTEVKREIRSQRAVLDNQHKVTERQRKEMRVAIDAARSFLDRDLKDKRERLEQDLEASQQVLSERVKRAVDRAKLDLEQTTLRRWQSLHHNTIRAACRRGGVHHGATGKNDFPADLCKPILDGIAFAWSEFFGEKLRHIIEKWGQKLHGSSDDYRRGLLEAVRRQPDLPPEVIHGLEQVFDTTERVVNEILAQTTTAMEDRVLEKQRTLYESIPDQVSANMQAAFEKSAEETGAGMKQRIVSILSEHAHKVSQVMFDDAQEALLKGVRSLNNWLGTEYEKMTNAVRRNAGIAAENLVSSKGTLTEEHIAVELALLTDLENLLEGLQHNALTENN
ncbi:MAG: dynamin family protein [Planctomycetaceae bacterium]|nr:dynamin family protein [Planctomycetaceae bacterium]